MKNDDLPSAPGLVIAKEKMVSKPFLIRCFWLCQTAPIWSFCCSVKRRAFPIFFADPTKLKLDALSNLSNWNFGTKVASKK